MSKRVGGFINQDGLNAPDPATNVSGTAGDEQIDVSFTAPSNVGGAPVSVYLVTDSTKTHTTTGSASPITVTGLTNGTSYTFNVWAINPFGWSVASAATGSITPIAPAFAIFGGGLPNSDSIERFDINTTGNGVDFGDFFFNRRFGAACGNATRSIFAGGQDNSGDGTDVIEYINPVGAGGYVSDFGDLSGTMNENAGCSNGTRGLFGGGQYNGSGGNTRVDYITIASVGNSLDFGDLSVGRNESAALASTTRAVFGGGASGNVIDFFTIASTGNATDFGDLTTSRNGLCAASSNTRGLFAGSNTSPADVIDYITIASAGNAVDFGDLTENKGQRAGATSSPTRAVIAGGFNGSDTSTRIDYVTIASTGNAAIFGNLNQSRRYTMATSTAHGGLS